MVYDYYMRIESYFSYTFVSFCRKTFRVKIVRETDELLCDCVPTTYSAAMHSETIELDKVHI